MCVDVDVFSRNKVLKGGSILFHALYILLAVTGENPIRPLNIVVNKKVRLMDDVRLQRYWILHVKPFRKQTAFNFLKIS